MSRTKSVREERRAGETLASTVYGRLRHDIIGGELPPGSKLPMRELCQRYAVGISPLREALNRLSRDGLIKQFDQRGFTVAPLSVEELDILTKTRCWLNELALRQSIAQGDSAWEERVVVAYHRLSRVPVWDTAEGSINSAWEAAHRSFHLSLISACGSPWLLSYCEQLFDVADRYRSVCRSALMLQRRQDDEHRPLMDATISRDVETAVEIMTRHLVKTAELSREFLVNREGSGTAPPRIKESVRKSPGRRGMAAE